MSTAPVFNRKNPCLARLARSERLTKPGSEKDTWHFEIDLGDSGLAYEPGDSLAVLPQNDPGLVEEIIALLGATGDEPVINADKVETTLRTALLKDCVITTVDNKLLRSLAERAPAPELTALLDPERKKDLADFLWGREVIDLLLAYPQVRFAPADLVAVLKKLQVRLYSISSSLRACPAQVHLTVATVEYESHGRRRKGVASTWMAQRLDGATPIPCFINPGKGFRMPAPDDPTPIIMIGPGTGIAPFRAFVQERRATRAQGRAWLIFGEQRRACDYFYESEWQEALTDGALTRLSTAFSRDQAEKFYVQHAMKQEAADVWAWLEEGGIVYVCGDASRMAVDVDRALHDIVATQGGLTSEDAAAYIENLRQQKRYRRDVY